MFPQERGSNKSVSHLESHALKEVSLDSFFSAYDGITWFIIVHFSSNNPVSNIKPFSLGHAAFLILGHIFPQTHCLETQVPGLENMN